MSVTLAPPVFDLPRPLIPSRVSVNTTNPPAIKHRHDRAAASSFLVFSPVPGIFLCPCSSFSFRAPFISLGLFTSFLSLPHSLFCKTTASMHVREQPVWIATALGIQHRIINYSRTVCCACIQIFGRGKTARSTTRFAFNKILKSTSRYRYNAEVGIFIASVRFGRGNKRQIFYLLSKI